MLKTELANFCLHVTEDEKMDTERQKHGGEEKNDLGVIVSNSYVKNLVLIQPCACRQAQLHLQQLHRDCRKLGLKCSPPYLSALFSARLTTTTTQVLIQQEVSMIQMLNAKLLCDRVAPSHGLVTGRSLSSQAS